MKRYRPLAFSPRVGLTALGRPDDGGTPRHGFTRPFILVVTASMVVITVISTSQRVPNEVVIPVIAALIALAPLVAYFVCDTRMLAIVTGGCGWLATALFVLSAGPVRADTAPLLLAVTVAVVSTLGTAAGSAAAAIAATVLLVAAAALHRIDGFPLYLTFVVIACLVGNLLRLQQQVIVHQLEAQTALADRAVADERRRVAREVHDVVAHSLSVVLLHVTGARRALEQDGAVHDAAAALRDVEAIGGQAMGDIRCAIGLLDDAPLGGRPQPGLEDLPALIDAFTRAGIRVSSTIQAPRRPVSATMSLEVYRIVQESLTNVAKHAPREATSVAVATSASSLRLRVANDIPGRPAPHHGAGRGVAGMRERVALLGGAIEVGVVDKQWVVRADIPLAPSGVGDE